MANPSIPLESLVGPFGRTLRADGKASSTIDRYVGTVTMLIGHLPDGIAVDEVTRHHLRDWMSDLRDRNYADSSLSSFYRAMQQFWKWAILDEYIEADVDPMAGLKAPRVAEKAVPLLTDVDIEALLRITEGRDFFSRRDHLVIRLLLDTGIRRSELANLTLDDVDLPDGRRGSSQWGTVLVRNETSKSNRDRAVPLGVKAMRAIDKYLPVRAAHPPAAMSDRLLLGQRGPMHPNGVGQLITRLGNRAGIERLHPHMFRHTYAHRFLLEGGNEHDLMQLAGWRAPQMVSRYGAAGRQERAFANFRSIGDQF